MGLGRSQLGIVPFGTNQLDIPPETPQVPHEYLLVYSRSSLAEMTTPASVKLEDADGLVSNVTFVDQDLDAGELGGDVKWRVAGDVAEVTRYAIFLAEDTVGTNRSLLGYATGPLASTFHIPAETPIQTFTHINVFAESSLVLATTPYAVEFYDNVASVSALSFTDQDADAEEIGGPITWQLPSSVAELIGFRAYLAKDATGTGRSQIGGQLEWNATMVDLPDNTVPADYTHVVVYTVSALVEQSTPVATTIEDAGLTVSEAGFLDYDLDQTDIGGPLSWNLTGNTSDIYAISHYAIYLGWVEEVVEIVTTATTTGNSSNASDEVEVVTATSTVTTSSSTSTTATKTSTTSTSSTTTRDGNESDDADNLSNASDDSDSSDGTTMRETTTTRTSTVTTSFTVTTVATTTEAENVSNTSTTTSTQVFQTITTLRYIRGRFIAEIPAIFGSPLQLLTSYIVAADTFLDNYTHVFVYAGNHGILLGVG
eukprot:s5007_g1.t1